MSTPPVAAIDLGSNTVRLLAAGRENHRIRRLLYLQEASRLGQGLTPGGRLSAEAVSRTLKVLEAFDRNTRDLGLQKILVGATMAVREASDGPEFMDRVRETFGFDTVILSGSQEAHTTTAGVLTALEPVPDPVVIFDLGGRSTEFILSEQGRMVAETSLPLGAVALSEAFLKSDPPLAGEVAAVRDKVMFLLSRKLPEPILDLKTRPGGFGLVGTAGTTTTLAAMAQELTRYDVDRVNNFRLGHQVVTDLLEGMCKRSTARRALMPGLLPDRADIIVAGAAEVLAIMDFFQISELIVSDAGLLEGLWLAAAGLRSIYE